MTCSHCRRYLHLYIDGRLAPPYFAPVEAHVAHCAACQQEMQFLESIAQAYVEQEVVAIPRELTTLIMARVASYEQRRSVAVRHPFAIRWGDGALALLLATVSTMLFVMLDPSLRAAMPMALMRSFPMFISLLLAQGPGAIAWVAWIAWVTTGLALTGWLAGAEVRSQWRRSLSQIKPQWPHLPQSFQQW